MAQKNKIKTKIKAIRTSDKSVKDNTQSASLNGDLLTITNKCGRMIINKYTFDVNDYLNFGYSFNDAYNHREFIKTVCGLSDIECLHSRIIDAQVSVTNKILKIKQEREKL